MRKNNLQSVARQRPMFCLGCGIRLRHWERGFCRPCGAGAQLSRSLEEYLSVLRGNRK